MSAKISASRSDRGGPIGLRRGRRSLAFLDQRLQLLGDVLIDGAHFFVVSLQHFGVILQQRKLGLKGVDRRLVGRVQPFGLVDEGEGVSEILVGGLHLLEQCPFLGHVGIGLGEVPLCLDQGIGVLPYSPLGAGFLTGKYRQSGDLPESTRATRVSERYMNQQGFAALDKLEEIGAQHEATIAQTAIAWVLANPVVSSAIIGSNNLEQLEETVQGADVKLSGEEKEALDVVTSWS